MHTDWPLVSVVILSFNRLKDLRETVEYCRGYSYPNLEFVVVDNGSHDGSASYIADLGGPFRPILLSHNSGSAEGHSVGMRAAQGKYIITIDDDAFVEEIAIFQMVKLFEQFDQLAVVSFNCLNYYQEYDPETVKSAPQHVTITEVEQSCFLFTESAAGFRKAVLEEIGYHQPEYFYGGEDTEMSLRILAHGHKILNASSLIAYHKITSTSRNSRMLLYNSVRNTLWLIIQYYPKERLWSALWRYHWYLAEAVVASGRFYYLRAWVDAVIRLVPMSHRRIEVPAALFSHLFFPLRAVFL